MAKIEDISAQSFQFTEVVTPTAPSSGRIKLYAKSDHGLYKQSSDGTETLLVPDTRFKGLRLAKRVIVPEGTPPAIIEFDTDDDGNPLNSVLGGELLIYCGANASITTTFLIMQLNGVSSSAYWNHSSASSTAIPLGTIGSVCSWLFGDIAILNQNIIAKSNTMYRYSTGGSYGANGGGGMTTPQTAITAIKLFLSAGTFPAGTVVEWHERG